MGLFSKERKGEKLEVSEQQLEEFKSSLENMARLKIINLGEPSGNDYTVKSVKMADVTFEGMRERFVSEMMRGGYVSEVSDPRLISGAGGYQFYFVTAKIHRKKIG